MEITAWLTLVAAETALLMIPDPGVPLVPGDAVGLVKAALRHTLA